jgi:hypothetical protein
MLFQVNTEKLRNFSRLKGITGGNAYFGGIFPDWHVICHF